MVHQTSQPLDREILLAICKIHILHHASKEAVYGLWLMKELAEHGHVLSPGTLYPILTRMESNGWLRSWTSKTAKGRRLYRLTQEGREVLKSLHPPIVELYNEIVLGIEVATKTASGRARGRPSKRA